ncbi:hypothetical protein OGAPHI_004280 [Ogataea philodendri]|uniref:TLC domain-containing protein n=1 Tax=Ogataea philodendri TaxID=1378263 RepID=A0A9P8T4U1_9ASCO|nr:uncharacterized protein OGAPHI_004280 [Ogataea philodendri]KAH3666091.1 hypothetical protein OGAPHI_004280 [Ogataea philodendri]
MTVDSPPSTSSSICNFEQSTLKTRTTSKKNFDKVVSESTENESKQDLAKDAAQLRKVEEADRIQIRLALFIDFAIFALSYFYPSFTKFYTLQYRYPDTNKYDMGIEDSYLVVFSVINLLFVRSFLMLYLLKPIAHSFEMYSVKAIQRFKEQNWSIIYFSVSWSFGFYLYWKSDYFFNCDKFYDNWPNDKMSAAFKAYYLIQTACWFQQMIVLHIEAKRKDHFHMFSHHIVTSLLCVGSYAYYFTKIGHVVFLLMDIGDVLLSSAKVLKYCGYQRLCDGMFAVFLVNWVGLRHIAYNYILYHAYKNAHNMHGSCEELSQLGDPKICYTDSTITVFLSLLAGLQVIIIFWMCLIAKVAYSVLSGASADDVRSDDSD